MKLQRIYLPLFFIFMGCFMSCQENSAPIGPPRENIKNLNEKSIVFFGNSLTAGYGLDMGRAYPELIQTRMKAEGYKYKVINAGISGDTTASGVRRIKWVLKQKVDILIVELGANDGLRGIPLDETKRNLQSIIEQIKDKDPKIRILLAGMKIPPNMGLSYTSKFEALFPQLSKQNQIGLIPFLLKGVAGNPNLNLSDGIHPNDKGQKIVAQTVWTYLEKELKR